LYFLCLIAAIKLLEFWEWGCWWQRDKFGAVSKTEKYWEIIEHCLKKCNMFVVICRKVFSDIVET
jgi:hypothetical protein